jgi:N-acyl-D-aspartate/D-glutamate deacylase
LLVLHVLSHDTACAVGLEDRGVLAPGLKADLNILDPARLHLHAPEVVHDLPSAAGGWCNGPQGTS